MNNFQNSEILDIISPIFSWLSNIVIFLSLEIFLNVFYNHRKSDLEENWELCEASSLILQMRNPRLLKKQWLDHMDNCRIRPWASRPPNLGFFAWVDKAASHFQFCFIIVTHRHWGISSRICECACHETLTCGRIKGNIELAKVYVEQEPWIPMEVGWDK